MQYIINIRQVLVLGIGFTLLLIDRRIGEMIENSLSKGGIRQENHDRRIRERWGRSRSNMVYFTLLGRGVAGNRGGAPLDKDIVPELGEAPCNGEDDAFSNQNAEHIRRDLCAM